MGAYAYQALDAKGKKVKGILEGDSERHVRSQLRSRSLKPLDVKSTRSKNKTESTASASKGLGFSFGGPRLKIREVSLITRQLASLVQSGLPLDEVLQATAKQSRKPQVKAIILQVRARVLEGLSLAQAMAEVPRVFDNLYRSMVRAGESAGFLGPVLEQLADYTERAQETKQKLQSAMIYPIVMVVVSFLVVGILMVKVVPKLLELFSNSNAELPTITKVLIFMSDFLVNYGLLLVVGVAGLIVTAQWLLRSEKRRQVWHRMLLRMPGIGGFILSAESARYANTLGLLVNSGVPLLEALRIASQVLTNKELQRASAEVAVSVQEGTSLSRALDQAEIFPPLLVQMAASGEANGQLADQLLHAARNQQRELEFSVNTGLSLLEPMMVLVMAGMVMFIVIAILLPIFQMNQLIGA